MDSSGGERKSDPWGSGEWMGAVVQGRVFWKRRVNFDHKAGSRGGGAGTQPGSSAHSVPGILLWSSRSIVMAVLPVGVVSPTPKTEGGEGSGPESQSWGGPDVNPDFSLAREEEATEMREVLAQE